MLFSGEVLVSGTKLDFSDLFVGNGHVSNKTENVILYCLWLRLLRTLLRREKRIVTTVGLSVISANRTDHLVLIIAGNNKSDNNNNNNINVSLIFSILFQNLQALHSKNGSPLSMARNI